MPKHDFTYLDDFDTKTLYKIYNYLVDVFNSPVKSHSRHNDNLSLYINDILFDRYLESVWEV